MKINLGVRFRNPWFIFQIIASFFMPILAQLGLSPQDIDTWVVLLDVVIQGFSNPFLLGIVAISVFNAVTDPTVRGINDSRQSMRYKTPRKDSDFIG